MATRTAGGIAVLDPEKGSGEEQGLGSDERSHKRSHRWSHRLGCKMKIAIFHVEPNITHVRDQKSHSARMKLQGEVPNLVTGLWGRRGRQ